ncbi:SdpI family protein [Streptococcus orisasini]
MKIRKKLLLITAIIILLPILVGSLLWSDLPDKLPTHFNLFGRANGYSSKAEAVYFLPLLMLAVHLVTIVLVSLDSKSQNINSKVKVLVYWIIPIISCFTMAAIYASSLGYTDSYQTIFSLLLGILLIAIGNYLPKVRQNYTVGIRLPWTLNDEENWNKTHRLTGRLWVIGGFIVLINGLLKLSFVIVLIAALLILTAVPIAYSYWLSK